jgi:hypothetical protein
MKKQFSLSLLIAFFLLLLLISTLSVVSLDRYRASIKSEDSSDSYKVSDSAKTPALSTRPSTEQSFAQENTAYIVQDSDLQKLVTAIDFKSGPSSDLVKAQWAKELLVANHLVHGVCDCEQRNWLNHFIETGNYAVAGSPAYDHSVRVLASLPSSDGDFAELHNPSN